MTTLSVRLPDSLHKLAKDLAGQDQISMNQFIASAVAEKISALATESYLQERAQRGTAERFQRALAAVPDVAAEEFEPDDR